MALIAEWVGIFYSLFTSHKSRSAPAIFLAYFAAGSLTLVLMAFTYQFHEHMPQKMKTFMTKKVSNEKVIKILDHKYPTEESRVLAKEQEKPVKDVWLMILALVVGAPLLSGIIVLLIIVSEKTGLPSGAEAWTFPWAVFVEFTAIFLLLAFIQGKFFIDPRYVFADHVYFQSSANLILAGIFGGMLGVFFYFFMGNFADRFSISIGTFCLFFVMVFDLFVFRPGSGETTINGHKYSLPQKE